MKDIEYMRLAIQLAGRGCGWVNPNPMVGAVIVKDNKIIGQGYHQKYGTLHAERNALANCESSPAGAVLYVTLEPCCHYGKTPPCTEAIIESGIRRVVIGSSDPNPLVAGKGVEILRSHGIEVTENILKDKCDELNKSFFHYIQNRTPYVVMKYAMTFDGKIATSTGKSKWITGESARRHVHEHRHRYSAIMVGVGTILADDPLLTCRIENGRNPLRIICDTHLRTPLQARVVTSTDNAGTLLATSVTDPEKHRPYLEAGCDIEVLPEKDGHINLNCLMRALGERNIDSVLLEGGGTLNWSALQSGIVNKVQTYIAPKIFGGNGKTPVDGLGVRSPENAFLLSQPTFTMIGEDILLESEVIRCSQES
ncbi:MULTISPECIES: bifunctional diaminohydroxyphosphoribosylaminopyrimidine deaminase/5-amino-6-(5-phosphoribosylamino)uracil reductase RibD [unclassified Sedimentibacter]|uniref:bifunctional diaminohydroxyphosphoribosylaminopyrimidine deaminase/5-amino-6-(5-phosphoribosylamino)uracil reductase RibD n=1 Tax=unclassified Sedimentibacter TaxID=2649220 RepID=UPI0027E03010|nr:bifunctional diaminohydroxyphosphoribosylaminopyrimidine deaminase/5-amino-6-(5-phosphoribosylamino)uracil reductase RibD [Sedimentibacter sp. MB35-C1]WMJ77895.1 bifunctional diaminohydroxyphosphoribosylaminopyrimidine deaminase/5-amino-6-(5-phosphoribosylamino)uracil reductase RibD [Sedimentibacter sp. MB35-C1]